MPDIHHKATSATSAWSPLTHSVGLDALFTQIAEEAPRRDIERDHPRDRIESLKGEGFGRLRLSVPQGGRGIALTDLLQIVQDLACADPNVAHAFRNHFFAVEEAFRAPTEPFYARVLQEASQGRTFGGRLRKRNLKYVKTLAAAVAA